MVTTHNLYAGSNWVAVDFTGGPYQLIQVLFLGVP